MSEDVTNLSGRRRLGNSQLLVSLVNQLIDNGFHILRTFPHGELSIRARASTHDSLDVSHFALAAELFYFRRDELEDLVNQTERGSRRFFHSGHIHRSDSVGFSRIKRCMIFPQ